MRPVILMLLVARSAAAGPTYYERAQCGGALAVAHVVDEAASTESIHRYRLWRVGDDPDPHFEQRGGERAPQVGGVLAAGRLGERDRALVERERLLPRLVRERHLGARGERGGEHR